MEQHPATLRTSAARLVMRKPLFKEVMQIAVVVRDLEASVAVYEDEYGIGPWELHEFPAGDVEDLVKDDARAEYGFRNAVAAVGRVSWELIQPLDERSNYADFLRTKGEGVHHVQFAVDDYDGALASLRERGHSVVVGGTFGRTRVAFMSTDRDLGVITEITDWRPSAIARIAHRLSLRIPARWRLKRPVRREPTHRDARAT